MNKHARKVLSKINSIEMFSKEAWKEVRENIGHLTKEASREELAKAFVTYQILWYEDNNVEDGDFDDEPIEDLLIGRFTDYILGD